jgi:hypothetical protein
MSLAAQLKKKQQAVAERKAGMMNSYRFKQAETEIRILPSWRRDLPAEDAPIYHDFGLTFVKDMDGAILAVVGDRKLTYGEDDEVRNLIDRAFSQSRTDAQRKHFKDMKASPRVLVNALVLNDKDVDPNEPQIVEFSESQFTGAISDLLIKAEEEGDDVFDLEKGFNLFVKKTGKGMETKYSFTLARRSSAVDVEVLEKLHDIDAFVKAKFADGEKARNALRSLMQGPSEHVAISDRSTDLLEDRRDITETDITDATYDEVTEVESVAVSDADIEALFDE